MTTPTADRVGDSPLICVDSSVLFDIPHNSGPASEVGDFGRERVLKDDQLLDFYNAMCEMVEDGVLVFPERVMLEARKGRMQDLARAFTARAWELADRKSAVPAENHLRTVINLAYRYDVAWGDETTADAYVIAIGLTHQIDYDRECRIATRDNNIIRCCEELGLASIGTEQFVNEVGAWRASARS